MHDIQLFNFNGQEVLDSRDVANMIGKRHYNLVRDIDTYISDINGDSKLDSDSQNYLEITKSSIMKILLLLMNI